MTGPDAIRRLRRLVRARAADLNEAKRRLAQALHDEEKARAAREAAEAAIHTETLAAEISAADAEVEAFARWLPRARAQLELSDQALAQAAAAAAERRAELSLVRAAAEAAENALAELIRNEALAQQAAAQAESDDRATLRAATRPDEAGPGRPQG